MNFYSFAPGIPSPLGTGGAGGGIKYILFGLLKIDI
jgi:hypothetical protein